MFYSILFAIDKYTKLMEVADKVKMTFYQLVAMFFLTELKLILYRLLVNKIRKFITCMNARKCIMVIGDVL